MATRTKNQNTLVEGEWNVICDQCGFKFKSSDIRKRWDGLMVCVDDWEPRHPLDFIKGREDDPSVPYARPDATDSTIEEHGDESVNITFESSGNIHDWNTTLTAPRTAALLSGDSYGDITTIYKTATGDTLTVKKFLGDDIRVIPADIKAVIRLEYDGTSLWKEVSYTTL